MADRYGNWVDGQGQVQRTYTVPFDDSGSTSNTFELFEIYEQSYAARFDPASQDTSFGVYGTYDKTSRSKRSVYPMTSQQDQVVTVMVVPVYQLDSFELAITDRDGNVLAASYNLYYPPWIQLRVKAGTTMKINILNVFSGHFLSKDYRLFVVGSTTRFQYTDISGPQQVALPTPAAALPAPDIKLESTEPVPSHVTVQGTPAGGDGLSGAGITGIVLGSVIGGVLLVAAAVALVATIVIKRRDAV